MAINKDFVVKNGLEVNRLLIRTNTTNNRVGINTDVINSTLDVNGQISAKSLSISGVTTFSTINVSSSLQLNGSSGSNGQYLKSTGTGVTWSNFPSTRTTSTITAVLGQTLFGFNYNIGFLDVFINGTKLSSTDFLAVDGNNIILSTPCFGGETVEFISYSAETIGITTTLIIGIGGITIQEEGSVVGLSSGVSTLNFVGSSVTAIASGIGATIYISPNSSQWVTAAGIHTLSNVGIGTTNPRFALEVGAVGASGTTLFVNGDARVTGIVTIGPASITLNGTSNTINVGTGITINGSTGIISATAIVLGGTTLTGVAVTSITAGSGISVNQSTGNVTITATGGGGSSQFVTTAAGIHTLSNVGIGTTNPTSALTVTGNALVTGVVTATTFVGALTGTATSTTNIPNLTGDIISNGTSASLGSFTSTALRIALTSSTGTGDAVFATSPTFATPALGTPASGTLTNCTFPTLNQNTTGTAGGLTGTPDITVNKIVAGLTSSIIPFYWENFSDLPSFSTYHGAFAHVHQTGKAYYAHTRWVELVDKQADGTVGTGTENFNVGLVTATALNVGTSGTVITTTTAGLVGIGTTNPTSKLTVSGDVLVSGAVTASSFSGSGSGLTNLPASSISWSISANDSTDYVFSGPGIVAGNTNDPVLYLYKGFTYTFVNTTGGTHPFAIRDSNGGSDYTPGVSGSQTGTQTFVVPMNAPSTLYYQCTAHPGMGNTINIV